MAMQLYMAMQLDVPQPSEYLCRSSLSPFHLPCLRDLLMTDVQNLHYYPSTASLAWSIRRCHCQDPSLTHHDGTSLVVIALIVLIIRQ